jgi:hypothetical protein
MRLSLPDEHRACVRVCLLLFPLLLFLAGRRVAFFLY